MLRKSLTAFFALLLVASCQMDLKRQGGDAARVSPISADVITVTPLDAPPAEAVSVEAPADPVAAEPVAAEPVTADPEAVAPAAEPAAAEPAATEAPPPESAAPELLKSPEQLQCERKGGTWARAGKSAARTCVKQTRDGGKQCSKGSQCEGLCLARSGTCAPLAPLFGCNEIFQDDGRRVTLCID